MNSPIRILIAEDNDEYFELLLRELKAQKIECSHRRAQTKEELQKDLKEFKPDLIISDYVLPKLDGMTVFRIAQDFDPAIPIIIVTDSINEETAVGCIKAGVTDYVIKEHLARLGPAVRAAIHRKWAVQELGAAEEKLRDRECFLSNLIESLPGVTYKCANDPEWTMQFISESVQELTGHPVKDFIERRSVSWNDLVHPEDRGRIWKEVQEALKAGSPYELTYRIRTAGGQEKWVWEKGKGVFGSDRRFLYLEGFVTDITDRKRAEETLRLSEERLTAIVENAPDPIVGMTSLGFVQSMNPEAERVSGYSRDEVVGKHYSKADFLSPKSLPAAIKEFSAILSGHERPPFELEFIRKDGRTMIFEAKARLLQKRGKASGMQVIFRDLTERKRGEAALRESQERFEIVSRATNDVVWDWDLVTNRLWWGENLVRLFGYQIKSVQPGIESWTEHIHPDERERVVAGIHKSIENGEKFWSAEYRFVKEDGTCADIFDRGYVIHDPDGKPVRMIGAMADLTERKTLERQLVQSQKMEAVGRLAGGIAHDFNNILTAITGYTELALKSETSESVHADLEEVYKAAERASALTRQLLSFSRRQAVNARIIEPNELIRNMDKMLRRVIGEDIEFSIRTGKGVKPVKADSGQMEQVIMNLAVNARDAVAAGGRVTIETSFAHVEETFALRHEGGKQGEYVLFAVRDTGHGMSEDVKKHLFEPFFTTKEAGKGTGLGLATCYGIVKQAGGFINVQSETGKGTVVTVYLPVAEEVAAAPAEKKSADGAMPKGAEKVLLVDDEATVRSFAARILRQQGYTVLEASSGPEALQMLDLETAKGLRLLFTDVVMPKMNGRELADKLRALRPEIKVLFASGFTEEPIVREGVKEWKMSFLAKPFSAEALAQKVREVLDKQEARP